MKVLVNVLFYNNYWYLLRSEKKFKPHPQNRILVLLGDHLCPSFGGPLKDLKEASASLREQ